jgi:hypothetical protein
MPSAWLAASEYTNHFCAKPFVSPPPPIFCYRLIKFEDEIFLALLPHQQIV